VQVLVRPAKLSDTQTMCHTLPPSMRRTRRLAEQEVEGLVNSQARIGSAWFFMKVAQRWPPLLFPRTPSACVAPTATMSRSLRARARFRTQESLSKRIRHLEREQRGQSSLRGALTPAAFPPGCAR